MAEEADVEVTPLFRSADVDEVPVLVAREVETSLLVKALCKMRWGGQQSIMPNYFLEGVISI